MSKILILDDSEDLLDALKFFLEKKGYEIRAIFDSNNIYTAVKEFNPDLIILDVFIKGKDSRELCQELRKNNGAKHLCIMLLVSSPTALENHREFGADACLQKPFGLNHLVEKIEQVLEVCKDKV